MTDKYRFIAALGKRAGITRIKGSIRMPTQPPSDEPPTPPTWKEKDESRRAIYLAYLDDFARMGTRHETVRAFYLSLLTLLSGLVALASKGGVFESIQGQFFKAFAWVGIIICVAWAFHTWAFSSLFKAKRAALEAVEVDLELRPFTKESAFKRSIRLTWVDSIIAGAFLLLFALLLAAKLPPIEEESPAAVQTSQR